MSTQALALLEFCLVPDIVFLSLFFKVRNDIRELNLTIVIKVPVKLSKKDIWVDSNRLQVTCYK